MFKVIKKLILLNFILVFTNVPLVLLYLYAKFGVDPNSIVAKRTDQFEREVLIIFKQYTSILINAFDPIILIVITSLFGLLLVVFLKKTLSNLLLTIGIKKRL
jgi:hypothetical protein